MGLSVGKSAPSINRKEMGKLRNATVAAGEGNNALIADYLNFQQDMQSYTTNLLETVVNQQMGAFEQQMAQSQSMFDYAQQDRDYYNNQYRPMREAFNKKAMGYDTVERREGAAAKAKGDVSSAFQAAKRNEQARLEGYGIDPSESRGMALDKTAGIERAKAQAQAGTAAANRVEDVGTQLQNQAIGQGDALLNRDIAQINAANQLAGTGANMGANALQGANSTYGLNSGTYGQASNMYGQTANIYNSAANQMLGTHNARLGTHAGTVDPVQAAMGIGGQVLGGMAGAGAFNGSSEGGAVPTPQEAGVQPVQAMPGTDPRGTDQTPTALTPGEFVIPEEAVRWKGEEYFHKQVAKAQQDSAATRGGPAGAIPQQGQQQGAA